MNGTSRERIAQATPHVPILPKGTLPARPK
jgi:hypothetical protein